MSLERTHFGDAGSDEGVVGKGHEQFVQNAWRTAIVYSCSAIDNY
jgi:hypothetical protein